MSEAAQSWFDIRPAAPVELPAVYESWAGTHKTSRSAGCIPNHLYNEVTFAAITGLLQRGARVDVLCSREAPTVVLAWVCYEADKRSAKPVVHYVFTRADLRERGYAGLLMKSIGAVGKFAYTHETSFTKYVAPRGQHNPGIARRKSL